MIQILQFLYLGKCNDVYNVEALKGNNIKALVTCCTDFEFPESEIPKGYENLRVNLEDMGLEPITSYFKVANNFIYSFLSKNQSVLIYCCHGVSRSSTIALSYLMEKENLCLNDAFNFIMKRKKICPNIGFIEQLCEYEKLLKSKVTLSSNKYINWYISAACNKDIEIDFSL